MASQKSFLEALDSRHSFYDLTKKSPISNDHIVELLHNVVQHVPSSFNSQSTRLVALFGAEHDALWDIVLESLQSHLHDDAAREKTGKRIAMFKGAYGTVMFFEDPAVVEGMQAKFPSYAEHFPFWSEHTSGMHQLALWTALEAEGLGANLQHYNPLIDDKVKAKWAVPAAWRLRCQLVFGTRLDPAAPPAKEKRPVAETVFVHGA